MTTNRLTPEEVKVLKKARQLFRHRTSQNHTHLMAAIGEWVRVERAGAWLCHPPLSEVGEGKVA